MSNDKTFIPPDNDSSSDEAVFTTPINNEKKSSQKSPRILVEKIRRSLRLTESARNRNLTMKAQKMNRLVAKRNKVGIANVSDVSILNECVNLVAQRRSERTRLHSIFNVKVFEISTRVLREFMNRNHIGDPKVVMTKPEMCESIVEQNVLINAGTDNKEGLDPSISEEEEEVYVVSKGAVALKVAVASKVAVVSKGTIASKRKLKEITKKITQKKKKPDVMVEMLWRLIINNRRYSNMIFGDKIRPRFATRGKPLTKDELTECLKTDHELHIHIAGEYNDFEKYNNNAFLQLSKGSKTKACSKFTPITPTQSATALKALPTDYDTIFQKWKLSRNHGEFGEITAETKLFSNFISGAKIMLYLHQFVYQFPDILYVVTGKIFISCS